MKPSLPVLASIRSEWAPVDDRPTVGKDVLELLSSAMYINPLSIYREYVQNAADSIEEAVALGLLANTTDGRVDITIDAQKRNVVIRDNGTGLPASAFNRTLIALGASKKRGTKARGFRGVGRLGGLGYCQELIFRSRSEDEQQVNELRWDCRKLRELLQEPSVFASVEQVITEVVRVRRFAGVNLARRFFEVELAGIIRHGNDRLISADQVFGYLSQVGPVPFSPSFRLRKKIEDVLRPHVPLANLMIYLNGADKPIFRPHLNSFEARKSVQGQFEDMQPVEIKDGNRLMAIGWILHHAYQGAIDDAAAIKGLRLRSGNMQVGEPNLLDELFAEPRFNAWTVGEIHVLDQRIVPNGRRDHFEQNGQFRDLLNKLLPTARELSKRCRTSSLRRNAIRQFESAYEQATQNLGILGQAILTSAERKRLAKEVPKLLEQMEKCCSHSTLECNDKSLLEKKMKRLRTRVKKSSADKRDAAALKGLGSAEKRITQRLLSLIYECSPNRGAARQLVDRILAKI